MARNSVQVRASSDDVFDVLDDAYAYPRWVVGTRRVRSVDTNWPAPGSSFHHAVGTSIGELHDSTSVVARDRPKRLDLEVRARPTGVARVRISVAARCASSTEVTLDETPTEGLISRLPRHLTDPLLTFRNALSLRRFRRLVEARATAH